MPDVLYTKETHRPFLDSYMGTTIQQTIFQPQQWTAHCYSQTFRHNTEVALIF